MFLFENVLKFTNAYCLFDKHFVNVQLFIERLIFIHSLIHSFIFLPFHCVCNFIQKLIHFQILRGLVWPCAITITVQTAWPTEHHQVSFFTLSFQERKKKRKKKATCISQNKSEPDSNLSPDGRVCVDRRESWKGPAAQHATHSHKEHLQGVHGSPSFLHI